MLKVLLTYDYELFLGKNHSDINDILLGPTEKISNAMLEQGASGVFFADICSAIQHRNVGLDEYSDLFDLQIKSLIQQKHDIQLHIHSSWYKSKRVGDKIELSSDGYKIHDFGFDKNNPTAAQNIIHTSKRYLENLCQSISLDYKCIAFRAGGFCIQPEGELFEALLNEGIAIDTSVNPHLFSLDTVNSYDFRRVPKEINWKIDPYHGIGVEASDGILEIPIATAKIRPLEMIGRPMSDFKLPPPSLKGEYVKIENNKKTKRSKWALMIKRFFAYRNLSLDTRTYKAIISDLEYIYKKHGLRNKDRYVCLICHPKLANEERIDNIRRLIEELKRRSDKYQIVTCRDVYDELIEGHQL